MQSVVNNIVPGMVYTVVFPPVLANTLAALGWDKKKIRDYICKNARMDASRQRAAIGQEAQKPDDDDTVPIIRDPRTLRILVAGGPGAFIAHAMGGGPTPGKAEIAKIELPSNWDKLVKKYKNVVPNYIRY